MEAEISSAQISSHSPSSTTTKKDESDLDKYIPEIVVISGFIFVALAAIIEFVHWIKTWSNLVHTSFFEGVALVIALLFGVIAFGVSLFYFCNTLISISEKDEDPRFIVVTSACQIVKGIANSWFIILAIMSISCLISSWMSDNPYANSRFFIFRVLNIVYEYFEFERGFITGFTSAVYCFFYGLLIMIGLRFIVELCLSLVSTSSEIRAFKSKLGC